jgi:hypothetical protein
MAIAIALPWNGSPRVKPTVDEHLGASPEECPDKRTPMLWPKARPEFRSDGKISNVCNFAFL